MSDIRRGWCLGLLLGAWVLWAQNDVYSLSTKLPTGETIWVVFEAFETKRACEAERTRHTNLQKSLKAQEPNFGHSATHVVEQKYSCWPDTIDPRTK
jgi:hypothetical protein